MRIKPLSVATIGFAASVALLPLASLAADFNDGNLPYTDVNASWDTETRIAVSFLTDEEVLQGNDDGSFAASRTLNRAEFMEIVMRLMPSNVNYVSRCFPDMPAGVWYEASVCRAKALGIVGGNALPGLSPDQYPFQPNRAVQYEEAVKVLVEMYDIPMDGGTQGEWYEAYVRAAIRADVDLREGYAGLQLSRGQMARLVANFLAYSRGDLMDLHEAQNPGPPSSSSSSSRSSRTSSSSSVSSSSSLSSASSSSRSLRPDPDGNREMKGSIILLDTTSSVLASASIFPNNEPVDVTKIIVYMGGIESIDALEIYRNDGGYLGRATFDSAEGAYVLRISNNSFQIDRRTSGSFYVRALVNAEDSGGWSGEQVLVDHITVVANGLWSNNTPNFSTSEEFPESVTARAKITLVENEGVSNETLSEGTNQEIGRFRITGTATDSQAGVMLQTLVFQINKTTEVSLANAVLTATDTNATSSCTISSGLLTCSSIPASLGDIGDDERTFVIRSDVSLTPGTGDALLQLILNDAGGPASTGSITWNDNEAVFTWVDTTTFPVRGTAYTR